ncbi:MAG TPA: ATP-binding protein, partial [Labilithrix sp.]|nr:ATP-binding protein [Labilithrix sp.]
VQWADNASLALLESLVLDSTSRRFCLVVAYRPSEIRPGSRAEQFLTRVREQARALSDITLAPLNASAMTSLVSDTFHVGTTEAQPLAELVLTRTGGNPFFVRELLTVLVDGGLIRFDGRWRWDLEALAATGVTDNLATLIAERLVQLPARARELLAWAACVGHEADLALLARLASRSVDDIRSDLQPAMRSGAVHAAGAAIRFGHDRVLEAVHSLIEPHVRPKIHRAIGEVLLASNDAATFDVVEHLEKALSELDSEGRARLVELERKAAYQARDALAFEAASDFFARHAELREAGGDPVTSDFALQIDWAETAYMAGRYELAEKKLAELLELARTPEERVRVRKTLIAYYQKTYRFPEAVAVAIEALAGMGIDVPPPASIGAEAIGTQFGRLSRNLAVHPIADLPALADAKDTTTADAVAILVGAGVPLWSLYPEALVYVLFEATNLSLERGVVPATGAATTVLGASLCFGLGQHELGCALGKAGLALQQRVADPYYECLTQFVYQAMLQFYIAPAADARAPLLEALHRGIEAGNRQWGSYCINHHCIRGWLVGLPLATVSSESERCREVLKRLDQEDAIGFFEPLRHVVAALRGQPDPPWVIGGKTLAEAEAVTYLTQHGQEPTAGYWRIGQLLSLCVLGDFDAARAFALAHQRALLLTTGQLQTELGMALFALALLRGAGERSATETEKLDEIGTHFVRTSAICSANFGGYARLLEAERRRDAGEDERANRAYDEAIDAFEASGFRHLQALATELAARHWLAQGYERVAHSYLADARQLYAQWGADAKVERLDAELAPRLVRMRNTGSVTSSSSSLTGSTLDVGSLLKATQAINSEIVLERVVATLLRIVLENAGAQRACLVLDEGGELRLAAESEVDSKDAAALRSIPLAETELPATVIYYVARTREVVSLVRDDPGKPFAGDPYLVVSRPASALAAPILHKGRLSGVLYLENSLVEGAFTARHLAVLDLLTGQIATSLENARLYAELEEHARALASSNRTLVAEVAERERAEKALRESEEQLRQAQKMEALGLLAGGVAHDFNNLLTVIGLCSSLLGKALPAEGQQRDYLEQIRQASESAVTITRQLLAFGRRQMRAPEVLDLGVSVAEVAPMLRRLLGEDIEVSFFTPGGDGVFADPGQVEQVVLNLAVNARDAMPRGGRLSIETRRVTLDETYARGHHGVTEGPYVRLSVEDTGTGMDAATMAHIYEPFFTTKELGKGTGLGLSTVFGIVEQSGGHITVQSEVGKGTRFDVYFPLVDPLGAPANGATVDAPARGSETILLVEDNPGVRALAREILATNGYTVLVAADGASAISLSDKHEGSIDLLLTDLVMPGMSGRDVADRLLSRRAHMNVLYMSAYADDAIIRHGIVPVSASFLPKPFSPAGLLQRTRQALDGSRPDGRGADSEVQRLSDSPPVFLV